MPKRRPSERLPSMVVKARYLRMPGQPSYERPRVPTAEPIRVWPTGFDAGGKEDWSKTRVASGKLRSVDVLDRALLMQSDSQIQQLLAAAATLPLREPLPGRIGPGNFAENVFVSGDANAQTLCIGDVLALVPGSKRRRGSAGSSATTDGLRLQVSSPRRPCGKIDANFGKTWDGNGIRALAARGGSSGWFVRVLQPGELRDGDELAVVARPHPQWSLQRVSALLYGMQGVCDRPGGYSLPAERDQLLALWPGTVEELRELAALPELARYEYRDELVKLAAVCDLTASRCILM